MDAKAYWERRLGDHYSLRGVGNIGYGEAYNRYLYRVKRNGFRRAVLHAIDDPLHSRVLDIGSGTGFIVDQWRQLGCTRVVGSDLTTTAVRELRIRYPELQFCELDIGSDGVEIDGSFDVVSAFDILYHVMDEEAYGRALRNVHGLLRPGGAFLFSDIYSATNTAMIGHHTVFRGWSYARDSLESAGFQLAYRSPLYVLMERPYRLRNRFLLDVWKILGRLARARDAVAVPTGALLATLDVVLTRLLPRGPGIEVFVWKARGPEE